MTDDGTIQEKPSSNDERIDEALLQLAAEGAPLTHDAVAKISGVSRRTVYRRYADQVELRKRLWNLLSPPGGMPRNLHDLLDRELRETFEKFDRQAAAMTVASASPEGRQMRLEMKAERVAAYSAIFGPHTDRLTEEQARKAHAAMQLLCCGLAWREMRDQWDLNGPDAAEASAWAVKVLIAHLDREGAQAFDVPTPH
ncbi:hypothetical protein SZ64_07690 [Erythrobacter sp. SG61-1L]|uniref:hypothetical protein n=1 Tax=Erythrobacter sp. SG61-1L TaxID=1603897 RepID=UPI0006C90266|nr:hypothetical protein [Erythrobacter sp. SG61-1L]KPL68014.1 hypothetical protein SZ64_07690 [Erythrobacter sp. SG61-1L]